MRTATFLTRGTRIASNQPQTSSATTTTSTVPATIRERSGSATPVASSASSAN